jgi:hypothetical protein
MRSGSAKPVVASARPAVATRVIPRIMGGLLLQQELLNAWVSSWKNRSGPNLGQQLHQFGQWARVELLHGADERVPQLRIGKSFAQPVELLDGPVPRQGIRQASLIAQIGDAPTATTQLASMTRSLTRFPSAPPTL